MTRELTNGHPQRRPACNFLSQYYFYNIFLRLAGFLSNSCKFGAAKIGSGVVFLRLTAAWALSQRLEWPRSVNESKKLLAKLLPEKCYGEGVGALIGKERDARRNIWIKLLKRMIHGSTSFNFCWAATPYCDNGGSWNVIALCCESWCCAKKKENGKICTRDGY